MESTSNPRRSLRLVNDIEAPEERDWRDVDSLDKLLSAIGRYPKLTRPEEMRLAELMEAGDAGARERLIGSSLWLVARAACDPRWQDVPIDDVVRRATAGMVVAVDRFERVLGTPFSTYAYWWIQQAVARGLAGARAPIAA
jgi:DNA-directed RNA polymerase sigma subunit (sigma70/sigma32)